MSEHYQHRNYKNRFHITPSELKRIIVDLVLVNNKYIQRAYPPAVDTYVIRMNYFDIGMEILTGNNECVIRRQSLINNKTISLIWNLDQQKKFVSFDYTDTCQTVWKNKILKYCLLWFCAHNFNHLQETGLYHIFSFVIWYLFTSVECMYSSLFLYYVTFINVRCTGVIVLVRPT